VARFDDLGAAHDPGGSSGERRVARFDDLEEAAGPETPVAAFDGLGGAVAAEIQVAGLDDLDGSASAGTRVAAIGDLDGGRRDPATVTALGGARGPTGPVQPRRSTKAVRPEPDKPVDPVLTDDEVPPDAPLPRSRRGGRTRRRTSEVPDAEPPGPEADPGAVAREICLRLLTDRARTRQELAQALARKGVPADAAAAVLDRFDEVGLIDDAAFAGQWVRSRHTQRGLARRAIAMELRRKGVSDEDAGDALAEVDTESEERRARELVDRKMRSLALGTAEQRAVAGRRLVGMLARKGYDAGVAYGVVREALAERPSPEETGDEALDDLLSDPDADHR
jgi:regulatory protein